MENSSREFTYEKIKQLIKHQQEKYNWEFIFLGANSVQISILEKKLIILELTRIMPIALKLQKLVLNTCMILCIIVYRK
ncbi:hypothetical protein CULT_240011 [[Clostridium] ultunense Esp]|nr:hypothetical protein CULT_240011 [[Clostridium] ultunense Esp]